MARAHLYTDAGRCPARDSHREGRNVPVKQLLVVPRQSEHLRLLGRPLGGTKRNERTNEQRLRGLAIARAGGRHDNRPVSAADGLTD